MSLEPATAAGPQPPDHPPPAAQGLSSAEAARRLAEDGPNELPHERRRGTFRIALSVMREPMFLMLLAAGALYFAVGDASDALMLMGFVLVVMGITIVEERRTERALDSLRELSSPRANVVRDGTPRRIPGREVVRGDLLLVAEGDRIPADGILRSGGNVSADESVLTGESVPVSKRASPGADALDRPGGDDLPSLFSGTLVTAGQGTAVVVATGARTELGKIGKALQSVERGLTPLQSATARLVRDFALLGLLFSTLVAVAFALTRGGTAASWRDGALAGIALAMSILPEEFPVILTVFLALGAWRISRRHVLTRRMPAVETLGAATVLCVDKTGTLTQNQMTLAAVDADGERFEARGDGALPPQCRDVLEMAVLASRIDPFDPMERALWDAARRFGVRPPHREPVREYPLTPEVLAVSHVYRTGDDGSVLVAAKGAPEAIADLCGIAGEDRSVLASRVSQLASEGLRVLGVATAVALEHELPEHHAGLRLTFLGLLALHDPVRAAVPGAVAECRSAGIRVVMITGDYPTTAHSIAAEAGIESAGEAITGAELDRMSDEELRERAARVGVFARVVPQQKLRIVEALKRSGEIVGMTGDGVNDAPALKAAHIGVAMGGRGTDVAREAAALVLLDDEFTSIVAAVRLGRRIFDNIRKAFSYTFAVHVPIAGLSLLPVFLRGYPLLLLPVHIAFMELIISPACSLIFEAEEAEPDVMRRPPRDPRQRLFSASLVGWGVIQGAGALALSLLSLWSAHLLGQPERAERAVLFTTLVMANLFLILGNRSQSRSTWSMLREPNAALWWVVAGTVFFLTLALSVPPLRQVFHFALPSAQALAVGIAAGIATVFWVDALKLLRVRPGNLRPAVQP